MKTTCFLGILMLSNFTVCYSQHSSFYNSSTAIICGQLRHSKGDTLSFYYYRDVNEFELDKIPVNAVTDKHGNFKIILPSKHVMHGRVQFYLRANDWKELSPGQALIENGDSIYMDINLRSDSSADIIYAGRGSGKFTCLQQIFELQQRLNLVRERQKKDSVFFENNNFDNFCSSKQYEAELDLLKKFRGRLTPAVYNIMYADIIGRHHYIVLNELYSMELKPFPEVKARSIKMLHQSFLHLPASIKKIIVYSNIFIKFLNDWCYKKTLVDKGEYISILDVYSNIVSFAPRDDLAETLFKLMAFGNRFYKAVAPEIVDSLWRVTLARTTSDIAKKYITKEANRKYVGNKVLYFSFPNTVGKLLTLDDFLGKVVLVDIWFTGCGGCLGYSYRLEKSVYPLFENNNEVVFLSLCGDKDKVTWLRSVEQELYTRRKNVNVYTNGLGFNHPFTKYYDFDGGPFSLLIDKKGCIFSGTPPTADMKALNDLIQQALNTK